MLEQKDDFRRRKVEGWVFQDVRSLFQCYVAVAVSVVFLEFWNQLKFSTTSTIASSCSVTRYRVAKRYIPARGGAYRSYSHLSNASEAAPRRRCRCRTVTSSGVPATLTSGLNLQQGGFLAVFYSNHSFQMHRFELEVWDSQPARQTTDGRTAALFMPPIPYDGSIIGSCNSYGLLRQENNEARQNYFQAEPLSTDW